MAHGKESAAMQDMGVYSLGREDPLEQIMATLSSILARKNLMDRGAWWGMAYGVRKKQTRLKQLSTHYYI